MTMCRDTHFAATGEKVHSIEMPFFKKAVLLFVKLSEAIFMRLLAFYSTSCEANAAPNNSYGYITMNFDISTFNKILLVK